MQCEKETQVSGAIKKTTRTTRKYFFYLIQEYCYFDVYTLIRHHWGIILKDCNLKSVFGQPLT